MEIVQTAITIVLFFLILGTLVVIHEVGHFVTARLAGVRVLEFGIGFPPRARVIKSDGETLYTLNWLPIGGFVKLEGEDGDDTDDPRSFVNARLPVKLVILVSGVFMNLLLAFAIFLGIALVGEPTLGIRATAIQAGSPAAEVGLQPGDTIVTVNGQSFNLLDGESPLISLQAFAGQQVMLGVERPEGGIRTFAVTLRPASQINEDQGALGIEGPRHVTTNTPERYPVGAAIGVAGRRTTEAFGLILDGLRQLGEAMISRPTEAPPAAGPVGIAIGIGNTFWQLGLIPTLYLAGLLSANLAIVNILPFPPLDGGRMLILTLKTVVGQRISVRAERLTYAIGFIFLLTFLVWITGFDIVRQLSGQ
jgi:regulator of sigma E protease